MGSNRLDAIILQAQSSDLSDPLIDHQDERVIYIGIFLLLIVAVLAIGVFSQAVRAAILFAIFLSMILIVLLVAA